MNRNGGAARSLIAGTIALGLVVMAVPMAALGLGEDTDLLFGTLEVSIASPQPGDEFSRIEDVAFVDGTTSNLCPIASWLWEFGDQSMSPEQNPSHRFTSLATYEATLFVVGECGRMGIASVVFDIVNLAPEADVVLASGAPLPGQPLAFDGSGSADLDGSIASYTFTVDGTALPSQTSPTLERAFTVAGPHSVELRVADDEGASSDPDVILFELPAGPLASLRVSDALDVPAGGSFAFDALGADAWGNAVQASPAWSSTCGGVGSDGLFLAPGAAGPCEVAAQQDGIEGRDAFHVIPGPLAGIAIAGPDSVVAGSTELFSAEGADAFGNAVALAEGGIVYTAPTAAGSDELCHTEGDVTGCKTVSILPDVLASLLVTGPERMVAGSTASFAVQGFDQYGNAVTLSASSFDFTVPERAGSAQACTTEQDFTSCALVEIDPDALASIGVTGPGQMAAGSSALFALSGADQYGNAVSLQHLTFEYVAPTLAGPALACYEEQGISGCADVAVVADDLATVQVSGPAALVAGSSAGYDLAGFDQYGNAVALSQGSLEYTAPTQAGAAMVCHDEQGASGCLPISVLPDALDNLWIGGPSQVVAGTSATFDVLGFDQYGNDVALAVSSFEWLAPTVSGPAQACHEEQGVSACLGTEVIPDALASITLSGPATVSAGSSADYALAGFDQYLNAAPLFINGVTFMAPATPGPAQVCHTEQGITGCLDIEVTEAGLSTIHVSGPSQLVAGTSGSYALEGFDGFGNPVALAQSTLEYVAPTLAGEYDVCYQEMGVLGCMTVQVLPDALAAIAVSGPSEVAAGDSASFALSGRDSYGNPVALLDDALDYTAPTLVGSDQLCYTEGGISGCADIAIVAGPLDSILLSGADEVPAGGSADYALAGFDQHGNSVALALASLAYQAPDVAGPDQLCYDELGVQGCKDILVLAGALDAIALSGPAQLTAGTSAVFSLAGSDALGNAVALAQDTLDYTAPTLAGDALACYSEQGIEGCAAIDVVPDALATISLDGPDEVAVGESASYLLSGADQYGNAIALAQSSLDFQAPTAPGSHNLCYDEQGASGCRLITVVHGPLASILVSGPESMVVGSTAPFDLAGYDAFGNDVPLAQSVLDHAAPTSVGPGSACYTEQGVTGCAALVYVADTLNSIAVTGPATVPAGDLATFALAGADQYGNAIALAQSSLDLQAPTLAGPAQACYEEQGVAGCADYEVVPGPLASIVLTGPASVAAGESLDFAPAGADAYGNAVPLALATFAWTAPTLAGPAQACYREQGIEGCASVLVNPGPLDRLVVTPATARTNVNQGRDIAYQVRGEDEFGNAVALGSVAWSATLGRIDAATGVYKAITAGDGFVTATADGVSASVPVHVLNVLTTRMVTNFDQYHMGAPVRGHLQALFADGEPVSKADVTLTFRGMSLGLGARCTGTFTGLTDAAGRLQFEAPRDCSNMLGDYRIDGSAIWKSNRGTATKSYRVTV